MRFPPNSKTLYIPLISKRIGVFRRVRVAAGAAVLATGLIAGCRSKQAAAPTDQQLTSAIQSKIQGESALQGQQIQVSVTGGVATLSGAVIDNASRALAGNDSGSVTGVKTVVNNLTVQPEQQAQAAPASTPGQARESRKENGHRERRGRDGSRRSSDNAPPQRQADNAPPPLQNTPPPQMQEWAPPPPAQPAEERVTLRAGTVIPVILTEALDTKTAQPNDVFHGTLASDLRSGGIVAIPRGARVLGQVVDTKEAAHFKGQAYISLDLTQISVYGRKIDVQTDTFSQEGKARGKNTAEKTGGGALLGALIGGLAGGGKGAAIGAIAGGGAGAGVNAVTRGQEIQLPSESRLDFHLQAPVTITVTTPQHGVPVNSEPTLQRR
jgi:hypothetical protein